MATNVQNGSRREAAVQESVGGSRLPSSGQRTLASQGPTRTAPEGLTPEEQTELRHLLDRIIGQDEKAVMRASELWQQSNRQCHYLAELALNAMSKVVEGGNPVLTSFMMIQDIKSMERELAGPYPTPLETLLAKQVAQSYAILQLTEADHASRLSKEAALGIMDHVTRRLDRAQARFLKASQTLAQIRRLQAPTLVQVNLANQQINVSG